MHHDRAKPYEVTLESEDTGLFRTGLCQIMVGLVPLIRRNSRQDFVITGYVGTTRQVAVVFAGRRMPSAKPLVTHLEQQRTTMRRQAMQQRRPMPDVRDLRLPVQIDGTWRKSVVRDADGWQRNTYEFLAAEWTIVNSRGEPMAFGAPPVVPVSRVDATGIA